MRTSTICARITLLLISAAWLGFSGAGCRKTPPAEAPASQAEEKPNAPNSLRLTEAAIRTGGIAVERARLIETVHSIGGVGELQFNGRRLAHLTARIAGRLDRVAAFWGDRVSGGQVLAEIYSQGYLALQADVLQAAERATRLRGTPDAESAEAFLEAARAKLVPLGITKAEMDALISTKSIQPLLEVRAPFGGRIIEQTAVVGDFVESGASLFRIADLGTLWAGIRIYEKDLAHVRTDVAVVLRTQAFPGEDFHGRLVLIGAVVDDKTRTVEGRVEVPNPSERLKPGMYVEASMACGEKRRALVIPDLALQEIQSQSMVFLQKGPGLFEARLVETGERIGDRVEILRGLAEGDEVVTAGSFLLKSEMLKATLED